MRYSALRKKEGINERHRPQGRGVAAVLESAWIYFVLFGFGLVWFDFETGSHHVGQASLELTM